VRVRCKKICQCGCDEFFNAFPVYTNKRTKKCPDDYDTLIGTKGAILYIPKYKRGHNPSTAKTQFGKIQAWNKTLKKGDHPSMKNMGFQPGHEPFNDFSHIHNLQRNCPEYRKKWLESKKGQTPWNKGLTKNFYKNGIKSGKDHGNWCGGAYGPVSTAAYKALTKKILKRDNYTCQECGDHNYKGRGSSIKLEVHHVVAVSEDHSLVFEPSNLITLCKKCHIATDNYGVKLINKRRKLSKNQSR